MLKTRPNINEYHFWKTEIPPLSHIPPFVQTPPLDAPPLSYTPFGWLTVPRLTQLQIMRKQTLTQTTQNTLSNAQL